MTDPRTAALARAAANDLSAWDPALPTVVEVVVQDDAVEKQHYIDPGSGLGNFLALADLLVNIAGLAWVVVTDLLDRLDAGQTPDPEAVERHIRVKLRDLEIEIPSDLDEAERDRIIQTVVARALESGGAGAADGGGGDGSGA